MFDHETLVQSLSSPIRIVGDECVRVTPAELATHPVQSRELEIVCDSGDRYRDRWHGIPALDVLDRAGIPAETTHLLVESADGYRVCIGVEAALEGLIAIGRNGSPLAEVTDHETRFVSSETGGPRTAKNVTRIETRSLAPGEDPTEYERLLLDE